MNLTLTALRAGWGLRVAGPACTSILTALIAGISVADASPQGSAGPWPAKPWRLSDAVGAPSWFEVSGAYEARYESLNRRLRAGETGSDQGIFARLLLAMTLRDTFVDASVELIDARIFGQPDDATTTTGEVSTADLLQGYVAARFTDAFEPGDKLRVQFGRHTMDIGSRRLVARNIFRNTINAFTGANAQWSSESGMTARAFFTLPIQRLPGNSELARLNDNDVEFDEERTQVRFWGAVLDRPNVAWSTDAEVYFYGLDEKDGDDLATANRDLNTIGTRWSRTHEIGTVHWEVESAYQFGQSQASLNAGPELDHSAYFYHASLGYTFDHSMLPRLEALFDYASGDKDPTDGENNRFDSLYGVPRMEFGPTGIFRDITRANLVSPGLRLNLSPAPGWDVMLLHRFDYLASRRDAWTTTGIQDPTGASGDSIGSLSEVRVRYDWIPTSVRIEVGGAYHTAGSFAKNAPNSNGGRDALYGYFQTSFWF